MLKRTVPPGITERERLNLLLMEKREDRSASSSRRPRLLDQVRDAIRRKHYSLRSRLGDPLKPSFIFKLFGS